MNDLDRAMQLLAGDESLTCVLCRGDDVITDTRKGIAPMMALIGEGRDLRGWSAADRIIGRAAALLFVLAGVKSVYAGVMSEGAVQELDRHGISHSCGTLTGQIINREGTGICPMEQAVTGIDDPQAAYAAIGERMRQLRAAAKK